MTGRVVAPSSDTATACEEIRNEPNADPPAATATQSSDAMANGPEGVVHVGWVQPTAPPGLSSVGCTHPTMSGSSSELGESTATSREGATDCDDRRNEPNTTVPRRNPPACDDRSGGASSEPETGFFRGSSRLRHLLLSGLIPTVLQSSGLDGRTDVTVPNGPPRAPGAGPRGEVARREHRTFSPPSQGDRLARRRVRPGLGPSRPAQPTTQEEERLRILSDPEAIKKKLDEKKNRPPFEFFKSQVAPFDILPFVKPNHWSTLSVEMRANDEDYDGALQTDPDAASSRCRSSWSFAARRGCSRNSGGGWASRSALTQVPKEWALSIVRPGGAARGRELAGAAQPDAAAPGARSWS